MENRPIGGFMVSIMDSIPSLNEQQLIQQNKQQTLVLHDITQRNSVENEEEEADVDFDDDYDYGYDDDDDSPLTFHGGVSGGGGGSSSSQLNGKRSTMNISHSVANSVSKMQHLEVHKRTLHTSRDDRATSEQCLDPRTRLMLFKMLSNGLLDEIDGCLSTGKEANVYYAKAGRKVPSQPTTIATNNNKLVPTTTTMATTTTESQIKEYAIKIYKTSILVFKDRDKYVSGEHRWRKGYCK